jgi:hypothetical protein
VAGALLPATICLSILCHGHTCSGIRPTRARVFVCLSAGVQGFKGLEGELWGVANLLHFEANRFRTMVGMRLDSQPAVHLRNQQDALGPSWHAE